jgi:predicted ATPase
MIVKRFRSFPTATVPFDNPFFLIGRNGSGRSDPVDAFSFSSVQLHDRAEFSRPAEARLSQPQHLQRIDV